MVLLISLAAALLFSVFCTKAIKKYSYVFYAISAVISLAVIFVNTHSFSETVNTYVVSIFTRGAFATALWMVVMWAGALKNGSALIKKLMPVRGELSIIAAILTLGHNIGYGKIYFVRLFSNPQDMSSIHIAAAVMSIIMLIIMIPLTVISFPKLRKKIKGGLWKKIQRTAYAFYALIYLHVMTLYFPMARRGNFQYWINIVLYSIIFIGYAVCRIRKWFMLKKKPDKIMSVNIVFSVVFIVVVIVVSFVSFPSNISKETDNPVQIQNVTENTEPETTAETVNQATENSTEPTVPSEATEKETVQNNTEPTESVTESLIQNNDGQQNVQQSSNQSNNGNQQNVQQSQNTPNNNNNQQNTPKNESAQPDEKNYIYNNGTYTAQAYGYDGDVTVTVTIQDDVIIQITGKTDESDSWYFDSAKNSVISQIIQSQQTNVDAVSGATYSSKAIMSAVQKALNSALR